MIAASVLALTLASFVTAAPVSSSEEYISTYISASDAYVTRLANATYTANATATVTVAETTVTVTSIPTSTWSSSSASASSSAVASSSSSSSTSEWVAPSSSTSEWVAPSSTSSTSEWVAPSSSSTSEWVAPSSSIAAYQAAAAEPTKEATKSNSGQFSGTATYFYQGGNAGSCGNYNSDSAHIVAVNSAQVGGTCGKTVVITNTKNGNTMTATCADTCPTCDYGSLDLSEGLFSALGGGDMGQGVFPISWSFA